jgi:hypothetical protein
VCATLKLWGSEAKLPENALAAEVESGQLFPNQLGGSLAILSQNPVCSERVDCLSIEGLAPTESRGDSGQNCLQDMSIVRNAELVWDG